MIRRKQVLVIGDNAEYPEKNDTAYKIGSFIAANGWVLVTGGRKGIMHAASQGAHERGGLAVAIIPDDDVNNATPYASIVIATGIGFARNFTNALSCDVVVAVGGGTGTLCEISYAWLANKPIISCSFVEGWSREMAGKVLDYRRDEPIIEAASLEDVYLNLKKILF